MSEHVFGPKRCRDSRKLAMEQCVQVHFYRCKICGMLIHQNGINPERKHVICCGREIDLLSGYSREEAVSLNPQIRLDYKIVGGYNDNAVQVFWNRTNHEVRPSWIYLKTFTGGYLKYVFPEKNPPLVFALADTDAFAYCDADPCLECTFRCKRGFELYAWIEAVGLVVVTLDKMSPYWESRETNTPGTGGR